MTSQIPTTYAGAGMVPAGAYLDNDDLFNPNSFATTKVYVHRHPEKTLNPTSVKSWFKDVFRRIPFRVEIVKWPRKKNFRKPRYRGPDRLSVLPAEVMDCICANLEGKDVLRLRLVSRTMQKKTQRMFGGNFLRYLTIKTSCGTKDWAMILQLLKYETMAQTVRGVQVVHEIIDQAGVKEYRDFFAEVMSKVRDGLEVRVSGERDPNSRLPTVSTAPKELLRALVNSDKKLKALRLVNVRVEYDLLHRFFAGQKESLQSLHIERSMFQGGTLIDLLRPLIESSTLRHVYLSERRSSTRHGERFVLSSKDLFKAMRNPDTGRFEYYKVQRTTAWFMGTEAVKVGFRAVLGEENGR